MNNPINVSTERNNINKYKYVHHGLRSVNMFPHRQIQQALTFSLSTWSGDFHSLLPWAINTLNK